MPISGVYLSNQRLRIQVRDGGGTARPSRPRSTSFTTEMDLSPQYATTTRCTPRPYTSRSHTVSVPLISAHPREDSGLKVESPYFGGHVRLPSTDSGIQADAGWDSLGRRYQQLLGKTAHDSAFSSETRPSLKTVTRCQMESRSPWEADLHSPVEDRSRRIGTPAGTSDIGVRTTISSGARVRTRSCDADVRTSVGRSSVRTVNVEFLGKAPTTRGEDSDIICDGRLSGENALCQSVDSALPISVHRSPISSVGVSGYRSHHLSNSTEQNPLYRKAEYLMSRFEPGNNTSNVSPARNLAHRITPAPSLLLPSSLALGFPAPGGKTTGPLNLLTSSTPVIPSLTTQEGGGRSAHGGDWVLGGRNLFSPHTRLAPQQSGAVAAAAHLQKGSHHISASSSESICPQSNCNNFLNHHRLLTSTVSRHLRPRVSPLSARLGNISNPSSPKALQIQMVDGVDYHLGPSSANGLPVTESRASVSPLSSASTSGVSSISNLQDSELLTAASDRQGSLSPVTSSTRVTIQSPLAVQPNPRSTPQSALTSETGFVPIQLNSQHPLRAQASRNLSPAAARPRHFIPHLRSKLSPGVSRSRTAGTPPTALVHPNPVKHVDTCSACLKPSTSSESSLGSTTVTQSQPNKKNQPDVISFFSDGLKSSDVTREPDVLLKLLEKTGSSQDKGGVEGQVAGRTIPVLDLRKEVHVPWNERRARIDSALAWLRSQLESLRAMDKTLLSQFQRCQDTIESLKQQQRDELSWGDGDGSEFGWGPDSSEFDEEEDAWEDWEIAEFERQWAENPDAKQLDITKLPPTSKAKTNEVTANGVKTSASSDNGRKSPSPIKQDVEATV